MAKKHKEVKFGIESLMRLGVFVVIIFLAINYLSNSKSNVNLPSFDPKVLGSFAPQVEEGQKWVQVEIEKLKSSALDQVFEKIKSSVLK